MNDLKDTVYIIDRDDNVATALGDIATGPVSVTGIVREGLAAVQLIPKGHKMALKPIAQGDLIIKYGVNIARATKPIASGEYVHIHNIASLTDTRTSSFSAQDTTPQDMRYTLED